MSKVDATPIIQSILMDEEVQKRIIYLNTIDQLFERGENSLGEQLGDYRPYTIMKKIEKGQRYDHVTLNDSGEYYKSYRIIAQSGVDYIMFVTNPIKDGKDIEQQWGGYIVGLNTENTQWLIDEVRERFIPKLKAALLQA